MVILLMDQVKNNRFKFYMIRVNVNFQAPSEIPFWGEFRVGLIKVVLPLKLKIIKLGKRK